MASNRGYTTATKVRDVMAGQVVAYLTDGMIEAAINRVEGLVDTKLKIGSGSTGAFSFTWSTSKSPHWVIEGAVTYGTALALCGPSIASWNTLDQLINAQQVFEYWFRIFMDIIEDEDDGSFVRDE